MSWFIPQITLDVVGWFILGIIGMIYFHEIGHYFTAENLGLEPRKKGLFQIETRRPGSKKERLKIITNGILIGFIPILIVFLNITGFALFLIPLYALGCKHDIEEIRKIKSEK